MRDGRQRDAAGAELYFFLSYAHNNSNGRDHPADPDIWVTKFFRDVCTRIRELERLPIEVPVGFMDRDLGLDHHWPKQLSRALASSRVFVPLYSRRYFESDHCGKEWYAFRQRVQRHLPRRPAKIEEIIPALWVPVDSSVIPAAQDIDFDHRRFGDFYAQQGIFRIMKLSRYRDAYTQAVDLLAGRIIKVFEESPLRPERAMPPAYDSLPSAFGTDIPPMPGDFPLRITVVALNKSGVPEGRSSASYGKTARDWNPYAPASPYTLADYLANLARALGYRPYVGDWLERRTDLLSSDVSGPEVLIVDPWAAAQEDISQLLREFDALDKPWVQVVVPWGAHDAESAAAEVELRGALDFALHRKLADGRANSSLAVRGVPSLEELVSVVPTVIKTAADNYLKHARAFPPPGPVQERARLALLTAESMETETMSAWR